MRVGGARGRWAAALIVAALLSCAAGGWFVTQIWPHTFHTHRDIVAFALEQHGVAFATIDFAQSYEESLNLRSFSAGVRVRLADGNVARGWIGCERGQLQCFLELRALGIRGERLPDLTTNAGIWDWQGWRERLKRWLPTQAGNLISQTKFDSAAAARI